MKYSKKLFAYTLIMVTSPLSSQALTPDFGDTNRSYQLCFKACASKTCYTNNDGNIKSKDFSHQVTCENTKLNCQFGCKDEYGVQ